MEPINTTPIALHFVLKVQVYHPDTRQDIKLRAVVAVPAAARLVSANDNEANDG
jgi:hypothetical protein